MIQQVLDSKFQSKVLAFLLVAPQRAFSPYELASRLRITKGKLSPALAALSREGIVKSFAKRGQSYYIINLKHRNLAEIKSVLLKGRAKYKDELFTAVLRLGEIKAAFLSGLFTGHPELPVDVLLVGKVNLNRLSRFLLSAKKLMGQELNYSIMTEAEFISRRDTFDRFIKDVFDYPHIVILDKVKRAKKK